MEVTPKMTIITVTFNCVHTIQRTIDSVLAQDWPDLEYIIVDGLSTDGTLEIITKNYNCHSSKIRFISEKDMGLYDAMNKGIKMATGNVIGIINGDDYYTKDSVKKAMELFRKYNCNIVYSDLIYQYNNHIDFEHPLKADHRKLKERMSVNHPTCFVQKNIYDLYGVFDINYRIAADYDIMARFFSKGCKFKKSDEVLAIMEAGGLSNNNWIAVHEKYEIHKRYFSRLMAEIYRVRNILLFLYRTIRKNIGGEYDS